jgi:hypothetical protein
MRLSVIINVHAGGSKKERVESLPLRHIFKHIDLRRWLPQVATLILILLWSSVLGSKRRNHESEPSD